ncbi:MAG TPA: hypothetical protein VGM76_13930 [Lacipirellulaceae bacterium]
MAADSNNQPERPQFAVTLGLLPPYTLEDVKRAYMDKVKDAHPDHGGDRAAFDKIQHAFEQGQEYLRFRSDRRKWIAARMEEYLTVLALNERLHELGAEVETVMLDWVRRSFGDFADLTESIVGIRLANSTKVAELVETLVREQASLAGLKRLELPGCAVTDAVAWQLRPLKGVTELDLSRTAISWRALSLVDFLPALVTFNVEGTSVGLWPRLRLRRALRKRRRATPNPILHPANIS